MVEVHSARQAELTSEFLRPRGAQHLGAYIRRIGDYEVVAGRERAGLASHAEKVPRPNNDARRNRFVQPLGGVANGFLVSVHAYEMRRREP